MVQVLVGMLLGIIESGICVVMNTLGGKLLTGIGSGAEGFRFLGISLIAIATPLILLACVVHFGSSEAERHDRAIARCMICTTPAYLAVMVMSIFVLVVISEGRGGQKLPGIAYKEYRDLASYSKWMINKVNNTHNWDKYYKKTLLIKHDVCNKMLDDYQVDTLQQFHNRNLSPLESGCCKPPESCKFEYWSPAYWTKPDGMMKNYTNGDCYRWNNDPYTLCLNCESCKVGFIEDIKSIWHTTAITLLVTIFVKLLFGAAIIGAVDSGNFRTASVLLRALQSEVET